VTFKADEVSVYVGWRHCMSHLTRLLSCGWWSVLPEMMWHLAPRLEFGWDWACASFVNTVAHSPRTLRSYSAHVLTLPRPPENDSHTRWHLPLLRSIRYSLGWRK